MYAIIHDGGRQYKVEVGQVLDVDFRLSEKPPADGGSFTPRELRFDRVLAIREGSALILGRPTIEGAYVLADVVETIAGPKIYIQKFRRRKNYRRRKGHRQLYLRIKIREIHPGSSLLPSQQAAVEEKPTQASPTPAEQAEPAGVA